jgi:HTH-type transcriptional regulator/antitoxin MqsA
MAENGDLCRICGEGHLTVQVEKNPVEYKGVNEELDSFYSVCDACGSEQADAAQTRTNKRLMVAFKKRVDGLLTGSEVRALRERLGLTQSQAAQVFGGGPVAFSKYESDDVSQSEAMDKLLRLADELPSAVDLLCRQAGVELSRPHHEWKNAEGWQTDPASNAPINRPLLHLISSPRMYQDSQEKYAA